MILTKEEKINLQEAEKLKKEIEILKKRVGTQHPNYLISIKKTRDLLEKMQKLNCLKYLYPKNEEAIKLCVEILQ